MSIKKKIAALLFGSNEEEEAQDQSLPDHSPKAEGFPASAEIHVGSVGAGVLEWPPEHPIYQLYELRRKESGYLPMPRVCMDEEGVLPEDMVKREQQRLKNFVTSICGIRLKEVNGKGKGKPKKTEEEKEDGPPPLNAAPYFFISSDKLYAWVIVFPPAHNGAELTRDDLYRAMAQEGISFGVNSWAADRLAIENEKYFTLHLIAKGKPAFDGQNGNIIEHFPRVVERMLDVDEFNQVDYTALNLIHNVKEGEEICRLIRPTEGEPGRTVLDQEIPAKGGKEVPLPKGRNTEISEDGTSLVAAISGHVEFTGRSFQVKPVLDIEEDVDFSTGDINFLGDVNIKGDVLSGFTVRAMGNVHVDGVLEAGSTVEAGGDLVVVKGILGDGVTVIRCHRSVFSKYIENAIIHVRENLQTDCIVNGRIYCDKEVQVISGRGTIMGGKIWAGKKVAAKTVGAPSECRTSIILGGNPWSCFERELLRRETKEMEMEMEKLECQPDSPVKGELLKKAKARLSVAEMKLKHLQTELSEIRNDPYELDTGRLESGIAYAGTEISFENEVVRLRQEVRQCTATVINGEIVMM